MGQAGARSRLEGAERMEAVKQGDEQGDDLVRYEHTVTEDGVLVFRYETWISKDLAKKRLVGLKARGFVEVPPDEERDRASRSSGGGE